MHKHITRELLAAALREEVGFEDLVGRMFVHLARTCADCRKGIFRFLELWEPGRPGSPYGLRPESLTELLSSVCQYRARQAEEAQGDLDLLLALPAEERPRRVRRSLKRFHNPILADLLVEESRAVLDTDPREAAQLAHLAEEVALSLPDQPAKSTLMLDLVVRARVHRCNALRLDGDLSGAEEVLHLALEQLDRSPDPLLHAETESVAASLRQAQGRFAEAEQLLDRAAGAYREVGDLAQAGQALLSKGRLLFLRGDGEAAVAALREALGNLRPEEASTCLLARHSLATYLCALGRHAEARDLLSETAELYRRFPDYQLGQRWLEGKITRALGDPMEAESILRRVRRGFLKEGRGYDAALVSLDLTALYAESGRLAEMRLLAEELVPSFEAEDLHRDALLALLVFQDAVRREAVTPRMIQELATYLERNRVAASGKRELPS